MHSVGVSILNYQAAAETISCVNSLLKANSGVSGGVKLVIQVSDNDSDAVDFEKLAEGLSDLPHTDLQRNEANLGFATGHNRNIRKLLDRAELDFIWLLNNDCIVAEDALGALLNCASARPEVGIWGVTLLDSDGQTVQCAGGCFYTSWLSSYRAYGKGASLDELHALPDVRYDYVAGASLFMPSAVLRDGLAPVPGGGAAANGQWLNEEFFLYFEEIDLAARLKSGFEMGWCRKALIRHAEGSGTGAKPGRRSAKGEFHSTLSALKFTCLYKPRLLWITALFRLAVKTVINLVTLRFDLLRSLYASYGTFLRWYTGRNQDSVASG